MEEETQEILKSVVETLMKKEAAKFRGLIQKELASKVHAKIEELKKAFAGGAVDGKKLVNEVPTMAPSAPPATSPDKTAGAADAGGVGAPAPESPEDKLKKEKEEGKKLIKSGGLKIVPHADVVGRDDVSLDPNFEKEFYHSSENYKGQDILIKQLGTGFGKPVRVYINGRRWEFFPGPKVGMKAAKDYIEKTMKDVKKNPELAVNMTNTLHADKIAASKTQKKPQQGQKK